MMNKKILHDLKLVGSELLLIAAAEESATKKEPFMIKVKNRWGGWTEQWRNPDGTYLSKEEKENYLKDKKDSSQSETTEEATATSEKKTTMKDIVKNGIENHQKAVQQDWEKLARKQFSKLGSFLSEKMPIWRKAVADTYVQEAELIEADDTKTNKIEAKIDRAIAGVLEKGFKKSAQEAIDKAYDEWGKSDVGEELLQAREDNLPSGVFVDIGMQALSLIGAGVENMIESANKDKNIDIKSLDDLQEYAIATGQDTANQVGTWALGMLNNLANNLANMTSQQLAEYENKEKQLEKFNRFVDNSSPVAPAPTTLKPDQVIKESTPPSVPVLTPESV